MLTQARLKELLTYDPETGVWTRRVNAVRAKAGQVAGGFNPLGYRRIGIDGVRYFSSRLAVLYMTGEFPLSEVDHKDGNPGNDRWTNLRPATHQQNMCNTRLRSNNTSGFKGVHWNAQNKRWRASLQIYGRRISLGFYQIPEKAHEAIQVARIQLHGEFARHQ